LHLEGASEDVRNPSLQCYVNIIFFSTETEQEFHVCFSGTNTIAKCLRGLHEGSVFSVCVMKEGSMVTGGGKDGRLVQLDASLNPTGQETRVPEHLGMLSTNNSACDFMGRT
jgi:hypothetical protein